MGHDLGGCLERVELHVGVTEDAGEGKGRLRAVEDHLEALAVLEGGNRTRNGPDAGNAVRSLEGEVLEGGGGTPVAGVGGIAREGDADVLQVALGGVCGHEGVHGVVKRKLGNEGDERADVEARDGDGTVGDLARAVGPDRDRGVGGLEAATVGRHEVQLPYAEGLFGAIAERAVVVEARFEPGKLQGLEIVRELSVDVEQSDVGRGARDAAVRKARPDLGGARTRGHELREARAREKLRDVGVREAHVGLSLPGQRVRRVREDVAVDAGHGGEAFALLVRTLLGADVSGAVDGDSPVEKRLLEDDVSVHDADFGGAGAVAVVIGDGAVDELELLLRE